MVKFGCNVNTHSPNSFLHKGGMRFFKFFNFFRFYACKVGWEFLLEMGGGSQEWERGVGFIMVGYEIFKASLAFPS